MSAPARPIRLGPRAPRPRAASAPVASREEAIRGDRQFVTALARGLDILSCFSPSKPEIGGTEIAAMTGLPQPTVWRLCYTMVQLGYLVPVRGDKLRPGIPVLRLGRAALASAGVPAGVRSRMQAMADRFASASGLAARDGGRMVFVARCLSEAQLLMNLRVGSRLHLATSAVGWAYLAGCPEAERDALVERHGVTDPRWREVEPAFRDAVAEHAASGVILNVGAFHQGYNTAAAPVMGRDGRPAFALSCGGSAVTHSTGFLRRQIAPELLRLCREIEREL